MTQIIDETRSLRQVIAAADRRHIALPGTFNLRDVGGYPTRDGGTVRWRTLLRSGALHRLDERGTAVLRALNLRTVVDLRTHVEAEISPSTLDELGARTLHISILGGDLQSLPAELSGTYRHMVDECGAAIAAAIQRVCAPDGLPALIHCSAGKDRTGVVVALILATIGVPDEVIAADYAPGGQFHAGQLPAGQFPAGQFPAGQFPAGQFPAGQLPAGQRPFGGLTTRPTGNRPELILDVLARARGLTDTVDGYLMRHGLDRGDLKRLRTALVEYPDQAVS